MKTSAKPPAEMRAIIYCRVSSKKQKTEGSGLESQEHRCRQHAEAKGYGVVAVFPDDVSGGGDFMKRPGMVALLSFLDAQSGESFVVMRTLQPTHGLFTLSRAMFNDIWSLRLEEAQRLRDMSLRQIGDAQKQIDQLLDRIVAADNPSVIKSYETRIAKVEREKLLLEDRVAGALPPKGRLEEFIELALAFLSRPWDIWENGSATLRRTVLRLAFPKPLRFALQTGYRTPEIAYPFKVLGGISATPDIMVL